MICRRGTPWSTHSSVLLTVPKITDIIKSTNLLIVRLSNFWMTLAKMAEPVKSRTFNTTSRWSLPSQILIHPLWMKRTQKVIRVVACKQTCRDIVLISSDLHLQRYLETKIKLLPPLKKLFKPEAPKNHLLGLYQPQRQAPRLKNTAHNSASWINAVGQTGKDLRGTKPHLHPQPQLRQTTSTGQAIEAQAEKAVKQLVWKLLSINCDRLLRFVFEAVSEFSEKDTWQKTSAQQKIYGKNIFSTFTSC